MSKILVDTNILIYLIDEDSRFHYKSRHFIFNTTHDLYITSKNVSEYLVVLTRGEPAIMSLDEAMTLVNELSFIFKILYPNQQSFKIFEKLLHKYSPKGLRIHDFEIVSIALMAQINQIATLNTKDFKEIKEIQVLSL